MGATFRCGACGQGYATRPELAGRRIRCRKCGESLRVPDPGAATAPPAPTPGPAPSTAPRPRAVFEMEVDDQGGPGPAVAAARAPKSEPAEVEPPPWRSPSKGPSKGASRAKPRSDWDALTVGVAAGGVLTALMLMGFGVRFVAGRIGPGTPDEVEVTEAPAAPLAIPAALNGVPPSGRIPRPAPPPDFAAEWHEGGPFTREEPRVDASTIATAQESLKRMSEGLSPAERAAFTEDVAAVTEAEGRRQGLNGQPPDPLLAFRVMDGKTRAEIHHLAELLRGNPAPPDVLGQPGRAELVPRDAPPMPEPGPPAAPEPPALAGVPDFMPNEGPDPTRPAPEGPKLAPAPAGYLVDRPAELSEASRGDQGFRDVAPKGGLLVGARVGYVDAFGGPKVGAIMPVYLVDGKYVSGRRHGGTELIGDSTVVARPGYAVGGIDTQAGLLLDAFRFVFMKIDGNRLDPHDSYLSSWIGDPRGGGPGSASGDGRPVVGILGVSSGREVNALGLIALD